MVPFLSLAFRSENGTVLFEGRPVPPLRCIAIREHLNAKALDQTVSQRAADALWAICNQLRAAMTEARRYRDAAAKQRRASFTTITGHAA